MGHESLIRVYKHFLWFIFKCNVVVWSISDKPTPKCSVKQIELCLMLIRGRFFQHWSLLCPNGGVLFCIFHLLYEVTLTVFGSFFISASLFLLLLHIYFTTCLFITFNLEIWKFIIKVLIIICLNLNNEWN